MKSLGTMSPRESVVSRAENPPLVENPPLYLGVRIWDLRVFGILDFRVLFEGGAGAQFGARKKHILPYKPTVYSTKIAKFPPAAGFY